MEDISKSFGAIKSLDRVNLVLRAGEVLGLVGDNGAGKSTLSKMLSGALVPDSGRIVLDDEEVQLRLAGRRAARAGRDGLSGPLALRHRRRRGKPSARPRADAADSRRAADGQAQDARRGDADARQSRHPHAEHPAQGREPLRADSGRASPSAARCPSIRSSSSWTSRPPRSRSPKSTRFSS